MLSMLKPTPAMAHLGWHTSNRLIRIRDRAPRTDLCVDSSFATQAEASRQHSETSLVSSHNLNSHNFKSRVSNPRTISYAHSKVSFESPNLPGSGPILPDWAVALLKSGSVLGKQTIISKQTIETHKHNKNKQRTMNNTYNNTSARTSGRVPGCPQVWPSRCPGSWRVSAPSWRAGIRSKQRDPNPKDNSLGWKDTSTRKAFHSTFAALLSNSGVFVRVRVPLFATQGSTRGGPRSWPSSYDNIWYETMWHEYHTTWHFIYYTMI